jgi:hypothetical protein
MLLGCLDEKPPAWMLTSTGSLGTSDKDLSGLLAWEVYEEGIQTLLAGPGMPAYLFANVGAHDAGIGRRKMPRRERTGTMKRKAYA